MAAAGYWARRWRPYGYLCVLAVLHEDFQAAVPILQQRLPRSIEQLRPLPQPLRNRSVQPQVPGFEEERRTRVVHAQIVEMFRISRQPAIIYLFVC